MITSLSSAPTGDLLNAEGDTCSLSLLGMGGVAMQLSSPSDNWSGTITFEGSVDGASFATLLVAASATGAAVSTATSTGLWFANCTGLKVVRGRVSTYSAGSIRMSLAAVASAPSFLAAAE